MVLFSNCRPAPPLHPSTPPPQHRFPPSGEQGDSPRRSFPPLKRTETAVLPQALKGLITAQDFSSSTEPLLIFSLPPPPDAGMAQRCCTLCPSRPIAKSTCASAGEDTNGGPRTRPGAGGVAPSLPFLRVSWVNKEGLTWENLLFDLCPLVSGSGFAPG